MTAAATALRSALRARLIADAVLDTLIGGRVHDAVPGDPVYPYVTFGPCAWVADGSKTAGGQRHVVDLVIWSRHRGQAEAEAILAALHTALDRVPLGLEPAAVWRAGRITGAGVQRVPDGATWRGEARYEALTV